MTFFHLLFICFTMLVCYTDLRIRIRIFIQKFKNTTTITLNFKITHNYSLKYIDVDECLTPANNCKFTCKNLIGSFACICPEGYAQVGSDECRDINECAENPNVCQNGYCVNQPGSYKCDCYDGFKTSYDGKQCIGKFTYNNMCIQFNIIQGDSLAIVNVRHNFTLSLLFKF